MRFLFVASIKPIFENQRFRAVLEPFYPLTLFLDLGAQSAIFWHLKMGTFHQAPSHLGTSMINDLPLKPL